MNNMVPQVADMFAHILANSAAAFSKLFIIAYRLYSIIIPTCGQLHSTTPSLTWKEGFLH